MKIRKARTDETENIMDLVRRLYSKSAKDYVKYWNENKNKLIKLTYLVDLNKKIVGYILLQKNKDSIYISDLYIILKYRKKGFATKLIKIAEKIRKKFGKKYLRVDVRKKDNVAVKLYERNGFKIWKLKGENSLRLRK